MKNLKLSRTIFLDQINVNILSLMLGLFILGLFSLVLSCSVGLVGVLFYQCLGFAPETHEALLGSLSRMLRLLRHLVFLVSLGEEHTSLVDSFCGELPGVLGRRRLVEWNSLSLRAKLTSIEVGSRRIILLVDGLTLFAVGAEELEEALVATDLDASDLEGIPSIVE